MSKPPITAPGEGHQQAWFTDGGKLHRVDGPAWVDTNTSAPGEAGLMEWIQDNTWIRQVCADHDFVDGDDLN